MPIRPEADDLIAFLNEIVNTDPDFMQQLVDHRPPCNQLLADHPTVQVGAGMEHRNVAGILGLLNGFLGVIDKGPRKGWGAIAAIYQGGRLSHFERVPES
ncbi:MAG: hypothetical protein F9K41_04000 [Sphingopyxis terrae]|nr:MAG: hypothetical protein F9K41_04000 [Sphingopyxis terrae]